MTKTKGLKNHFFWPLPIIEASIYIYEQRARVCVHNRKLADEALSPTTGLMARARWGGGRSASSGSSLGHVRARLKSWYRVCIRKRRGSSITRLLSAFCPDWRGRVLEFLGCRSRWRWPRVAQSSPSLNQSGIEMEAGGWFFALIWTMGLRLFACEFFKTHLTNLSAMVKITFILNSKFGWSK